MLTAIVAVMALLMLTSCSLLDSLFYSKSDRAYWFSYYEIKFVPYDDEANGGKGNLEEAGNYWMMTVKNDCKITIKLRNNSLNGFNSGTYFYVNDEQVKSDYDQFYSFCYSDLSLKRGDKLKLHCFWNYGIVANDEGFTMDVFVIADDEAQWIITDM